MTRKENPPSLGILRVIGSTAQSHRSFCSRTINDSCIIAYTAGAGAVLVCMSDLSKCPPTILSQKFLCTSTNMVRSMQLQLLKKPKYTVSSGSPGHVRSRDSYGYPLDACVTLSPQGDNSGLMLSGSSSSALGSPRSRSFSTFTSFVAPSGSPQAGNGLGIVTNNASVNNNLGSPVSSAKDKMKTSSCLALSPDGKLLAVGEIGHQPRVFVYSTAPDSSGIPLSILMDHRFGIHALAFSPCGRFLASLGTRNDGFLNIWHLACIRDGNVRLHSTNRCISVVHDLIWLSSSKVLTVGVRHVRVWTVDDSDTAMTDLSRPHVLAGRNAILGDLANGVFLDAVRVNDTLAIVSCDTGEIATVDCVTNTDALTTTSSSSPSLISPVFTPRLVVSEGGKSPLSALGIDGDDLWVADGSCLKCFSVNDILSVRLPSKRCSGSSISSSRTPSPSPTPSPLSIEGALAAGTSCLCALSVIDTSVLLTLDTDRNISVVCPKISPRAYPIAGSHSHELHGIRPLKTDVGKYSEFFTWSADGCVQIRNVNSSNNEWQVIKAHTDDNGVATSPTSDVTVACIDPSRSILAIGDTLGRVKLVDVACRSTICQFQAHESRVVDLCFENKMMVSCSRDRTIQVFLYDEGSAVPWRIHQTLLAHKANILRVAITKDGKRIISCSADRTIHIHRVAQLDRTLSAPSDVAFVSDRVITLRSPPLDMALDPDRSASIVVVTNDKVVSTYRLTTGELQASYKDDVDLRTITLGKWQDRVCLAAVGIDKSLRLYDHASGSLLGIDWGHSEGISGLAWLDCDDGSCVLASSGNDGCIFLWTVGLKLVPSFSQSSSSANRSDNQHHYGKEYQQKTSTGNHDGIELPVNSLPKPLRRILSKADLDRIKNCSTSPPSSPLPLAIAPKRMASNSKLRSHAIISPPNAKSKPPKRGLSTALPSTPLVSSSPAAGRRVLSSSRSYPVLPVDLEARKSQDLSKALDEASRFLAAVRAKYSESAATSLTEQLTKFRAELTTTLRIVGGKNAQMEELLHHFGDQLVSLVDTKLRGD